MSNRYRNKKSSAVAPALKELSGPETVADDCEISYASKLGNVVLKGSSPGNFAYPSSLRYHLLCRLGPVEDGPLEHPTLSAWLTSTDPEQA
jgi:hypothetical protein